MPGIVTSGLGVAPTGSSSPTPPFTYGSSLVTLGFVGPPLVTGGLGYITPAPSPTPTPTPPPATTITPDPSKANWWAVGTGGET